MGRNIAEDWLGAFMDKDLSRLELTKDFVHRSPYGEIRGRETYLNLVNDNADAFFSPTLEIQDVIDGGDRVAVRYLVNGNPACDVLYLSGGAIAKIYAYYNVGDAPTVYDEWRED